MDDQATFPGIADYQDSDYQMEQAAAAKAAAGELGVEAQIVYADNDPITQSTQVLRAIQTEPSLRPSGILIEPLGATSFPKWPAPPPVRYRLGRSQPASGIRCRASQDHSLSRFFR